jgi:hypothetical protein
MKVHVASRLLTVAVLALLASAAHSAQVLAPGPDDEDLVPTGKGWGERATPVPGFVTHGNNGNGNNGNGNATGRRVTGNGINYHGGPVMLGSTNVYYIWYGNWSGNSATSILTDLATNIGGSRYFNINTTYYTTYFTGSSQSVSNSVHYAGSSSDSYSFGSALSDSNIQSIVANKISAGALPRDTNAVYFVLTSADVNATSGFCTQYCGWHTHGTIAGSDIKYAFIGNPDRCPSACAAQTKGPNGNAGADGMASIISHELEEAVTDPDLNAWYDTRGSENADKCAWTFGATSTAANGSQYNVTLGSRQYLIQRNWVNDSGGYCSMSY